MLYKKYSILVLVFLFGTALSAQRSINFADITIEQAMQRAEIENKNIFVDTYAPWCGPCKKMNVVFNNPKVGKYFTRNFINVKIDMDKAYGQTVSRKYRIAFLPTLMILSKKGDIKHKVDKLMNADELLSLGKFVVEGPSTTIKKEPIIEQSPPQAQVVAEKKVEIENDPEEKILFVLDSNTDNLPPEILYEEAYFRLQFNDDSHLDVVDRYLQSQENWLEEKNVQFIHDFLFSTTSKEFEFFTQNKERFEEVIGKDKIKRTLTILIENRLYQGYPRPEFEEAEYLYGLLNPKSKSKNSYYYFLNRLKDERDFEGYKHLALEYLEINLDQKILTSYIHLILDGNPSKEVLKNSLARVKTIEKLEKSYTYFHMMSRLFFQLSDEKRAIEAVNSGIAYAKAYNLDYSELTILAQKIDEL